MGLVQSAAAYGVGKIMDKLYDDPETNMRKMMDLADKIAGKADGIGCLGTVINRIIVIKDCIIGN